MLADRHGFVVAHPDGHRGHWNDCRRGNETEARRAGIDDVAFVKAMIGWFEAEHGVARDRVALAGHATRLTWATAGRPEVALVSVKGGGGRGLALLREAGRRLKV